MDSQTQGAFANVVGPFGCHNVWKTPLPLSGSEAMSCYAQDSSCTIKNCSNQIGRHPILEALGL